MPERCERKSKRYHQSSGDDPGKSFLLECSHPEESFFLGHRVDLTPKGISFKADGTGTFVFPADKFPAGPVNIRIFASNEKGERDLFELQLYNKGGDIWNQGIPQNAPPAAKGLQLVFTDDLTVRFLSRPMAGMHAIVQTNRWRVTSAAGPLLEWMVPIILLNRWTRIYGLKPAKMKTGS